MEAEVNILVDSYNADFLKSLTHSAMFYMIITVSTCLKCHSAIVCFEMKHTNCDLFNSLDQIKFETILIWCFHKNTTFHSKLSTFQCVFPVSPAKSFVPLVIPFQF